MNNVISKSRPAQDMATAISSSLSKRSSPTIPLASAVYEPLVKSVLARRFVYNVLSESAAVAWLLAAIWTYWQQGGVGSLGVFGGIVSWLSPLTLFFAILWLSLASVPIAVLRKMYLQATYSPLPSPRQTLFRNAAERPYQYALVVTLASSACLTVCQALMAQSVEKYSRGDPKLGIWAGSRKHSYHLNGNLCFLFLSQLTCASFYWLRDSLKNRFSIRWSSQENVFVQAFPLLSSSLFSMVMLSATSTACSLVIFAILRSIMLPVLYRLPVIHSLLRPFVAHFLRPTYTLSFLWTHIGLIIRAFFLALTSHVLWEVPSSLFDALFSVPIAATHALKDPGLILVSGINSGNGYFRLHAFRDLCSVASNEEQMVSKRAIIYNDTKHSPTLWSALVRRSLLLLGADYQLFLRRGNPPPPALAPQAPVIKQPEMKPQTSVIRAQIYKISQVTPIDRIADTLASDSPVTGALARSTGDSIALSESLTRMLRSRLPSTQLSLPTPTMKVVKSSISIASSLIPWSLLPVYDVREWWTRERKDRAAIKALPNRELDLMIIEVLSKMVGHSLQEDLLGYVQRDIPCVLEAMVSFLMATEEYQTELSRFMGAKESSSAKRTELILLREEVAAASEWVEGLSEGLRTGITLIVRIFGDRLAKYRFPPRIATRLQVFADYI
ncbi:hypothetical protein ACEPAF_5806 [Sanghuangporus sanghuang]